MPPLLPKVYFNKYHWKPDHLFLRTMSNSQQEFSTDFLRVYYGRLFPYGEVFNWLSYGNDCQQENPVVDKHFFSRREFSFTIEDDIYIRYQSFKDVDEFKNAIQKRQPHKIDIGAVFTFPPKDHNSVSPDAFSTVERELVFDIDMTDYDDVRNCCSGANICLRCWPFMTMAIKVIEEILRYDFGYENILWVYSGRRGVHCWVCDESARCLSNEARAAIVEYISLDDKGNHGNNNDIKAKSGPFGHPMLERAYKTLEPYFEALVDGKLGQGILDSRNEYVKVLNTLPIDSIREYHYGVWERSPELSAFERWQQLKDSTSFLQPSDGHAKKKPRIEAKERLDLEKWRMNLVFKYCYPRLDANVSKAQNHLLKSPFCVHPKTGRVCIPIDPSLADDFNPFHVPTVRTLCEQVDTFDKNNTDVNTSDIAKTDMKVSMEVFERTFMAGVKEKIRRKLRQDMDSHAALSVAF